MRKITADLGVRSLRIFVSVYGTPLVDHRCAEARAGHGPLSAGDGVSAKP